MTKQLAVAILLMSAWALLGAYETIPGSICLTGLIAFTIGIFLVLWENRDSQIIRSGKQ